MGNPPCPGETLTKSSEQDGNSTLRQYVGGLQHQQGQRNEEQISLPPSCEAVEMLSSSPHHAPRHSSPGRGQYPSRLPVQEDLRGKGPLKSAGIVSGMAPEPSCLQDTFQPNREATKRPLCNTEKPSASYLLHIGVWIR